MFFCVCKDCYDFQYDCSIPTMECASIPCQNNGVCTEGTEDEEHCGYTCDCTDTGFEGTNCETEIGECASSPCQNEGTCTDEVGFFTCECKRDYFGSVCEKHIIDCFRCRHNSTCVPLDPPSKEGWECSWC